MSTVRVAIYIGDSIHPIAEGQCQLNDRVPTEVQILVDGQSRAVGRFRQVQGWVTAEITAKRQTIHHTQEG